MLRYETITHIADTAGKLGITKIRLTGGEPLVRKNVASLVLMLKQTKRFNEITMTTNGSLLTEQLAETLKLNGLSRINISLDTLDPAVFGAVTRGGNIQDVLDGIKAAKKAQLNPVKINMVIFKDTTETQMANMRNFCNDNGLELQNIRHFSLYSVKEQVTTDKNFDRPGSCRDCNRLRLTADGYLKPCLFSNKEIKVDIDNIEKSILEAIENKPEYGTVCINRAMHQIGG